MGMVMGHYSFLNFQKWECLTWLESEKQDGAEVVDVGGSVGCRRDA